MKTLIVILAVATVSLPSCRKESKIAGHRSEGVTKIHVNAGDEKGNFIPFSWQTKWFNKDLNSRLKFSGKEGC